MKSITVRHELPENYAASVVQRHQEWIEQILGIRLGECTMAEIDLPIERYVLKNLFPDVPHWKENRLEEISTALVERVELPAGSPPCVRLVPDAAGGQQEVRVKWKLRWHAVPAAVWLRGLVRPVVFLPLDLVDSPSGDQMRKANFVILRREDFGPLTRRLSAFLSCSRATKEIFVTNGPDLSFTPCEGWDHIVMDDNVGRLVRDDFQRFFAHRAWFESRQIPFRRGYLLYGPPGNGKTSIVRAMASRPGLSPCTLVWGRPDTDDDDLTMLFRWATDHAPALVIMEDLDRHFTHLPHGGSNHRISLSHLLNCLDGVHNSEGVIVVATANHPKALDPAILNRPGRFDRVVELPNPNEELRAEFFRRQLACSLSGETLELVVRRSAGFSFAQLRECYITAASLAFDRNRDVTEQDLVEATGLLARAVKRPGGNRVRQPVGFGEADAAA
ncbi:MAG: AAA family ATPase [Bryobacteraceae bacterium]